MYLCTMVQCGFRFIKFVLILLSFTLLRIGTYGQNGVEKKQEDSTSNKMSEEGGKNYAPTYYYYISSLFPQIIEKTLIDTSVYNPYNEDVSLFSRNLYATLGIFGQANFPMNFLFYRHHGFTYKTLPYNTYLRTIENWRFFEPEGTYVNFQYNFSNVKENHFSVMYAQKITDNLHFDFGLETIIAAGRYVMQKIRDVNLGGSLRYKMPSNRYGFSAYYCLNLIKNQENGGILQDTLFENGQLPSSAITVRFSNNNASNHLFQNTFFFRHYLSLSGKTDKIAKKEKVNQTDVEKGEEKVEKEGEQDSTVVKKKPRLGYLVHDIEISSSKNLFEATRLDTTYFPVFNFSRDKTSDWVKNYQIRNSIMWSSYMPEDTLPDRKHFIRFAAGIMYTFINVKDTLYFVNLQDTDFLINIRIPNHQFQDHQITPLGILHLKLFNRLHINANALITLNGYNAGDFTLEGKASLDFFQGKEKNKHEIQLKMAFYNYSPDYFFTYLMANNYRWENNFLKKQQTITAEIAWEHKNYSVGLHYYNLNHYTLLNQQSEPEQIKSANVYQLAAYIPFHIKGFGFISNIYLQYADNTKIKIPAFVTRQTVYYGLYLFKKALYLQAGVDFLYNTAYTANAYNPVLQQFYLQDDKKIGNYPYLDVFLRAKLNRFQFSVKATHVWAGALGYTYYLVPHYPAKDFGFALGVLWHFYD